MIAGLGGIAALSRGFDSEIRSDETLDFDGHHRTCKTHNLEGEELKALLKVMADWIVVLSFIFTDSLGLVMPCNDAISDLLWTQSTR